MKPEKPIRIIARTLLEMAGLWVLFYALLHLLGFASWCWPFWR